MLSRAAHESSQGPTWSVQMSDGASLRPKDQMSQPYSPSRHEGVTDHGTESRLFDPEVWEPINPGGVSGNDGQGGLEILYQVEFGWRTEINPMVPWPECSTTPLSPYRSFSSVRKVLMHPRFVHLWVSMRGFSFDHSRWRRSATLRSASPRRSAFSRCTGIYTRHPRLSTFIPKR